MNERERAEFERHKIKAEEQLNQMYYGVNKKPVKNGNLTIPSFLAPPKAKISGEKSQDQNTAKSQMRNEKSSKQAEIPHRNQPLKGRNILSFLNFKGMKMDNDRLIILVICLLLAGEETDELLILALIYIML